MNGMLKPTSNSDVKLNMVSEMVNHVSVNVPYTELPNVVSDFKKGVLQHLMRLKDNSIDEKNHLIDSTAKVQEQIANYESVMKQIDTI